jgi:hypothetical protein
MIPSLFVIPDVSATEMEATGSEFTVTVAETLAVVPFTAVTVTV